MNMRGVIYKYTNNANNKLYIGQTMNEENRRKRWMQNNPYAGTYINRARQKYGPKNFTYEILFEIINDDFEIIKCVLNEKEQYYIKLYKSKDEKYGYNLNDGGQNGNGQVCSPATRKLMSLAQKGKKKKPMSSEGRMNISLAHKGKKTYRYKKIIQLDPNTREIIKIWNSITETSQNFGDKSSGNLCAHLRNKPHHTLYKGYKWEYYDEYMKINQII